MSCTGCVHTALECSLVCGGLLCGSAAWDEVVAVPNPRMRSGKALDLLEPHCQVVGGPSSGRRQIHVVRTNGQQESEQGQVVWQLSVDKAACNCPPGAAAAGRRVCRARRPAHQRAARAARAEGGRAAGQHGGGGGGAAGRHGRGRARAAPAQHGGRRHAAPPAYGGRAGGACASALSLAASSPQGGGCSKAWVQGFGASCACCLEAWVHARCSCSTRSTGRLAWSGLARLTAEWSRAGPVGG